MAVDFHAVILQLLYTDKCPTERESSGTEQPVSCFVLAYSLPIYLKLS